MNESGTSFYLPAGFGGRLIFKPGLQARHWDSGMLCFAHQSPVFLKAGISDALQRVQRDSGT
jgi:hypothetical protein